MQDLEEIFRRPIVTKCGTVLLEIEYEVKYELQALPETKFLYASEQRVNSRIMEWQIKEMEKSHSGRQVQRVEVKRIKKCFPLYLESRVPLHDQGFEIKDGTACYERLPIGLSRDGKMRYKRNKLLLISDSCSIDHTKGQLVWAPDSIDIGFLDRVITWPTILWAQEASLIHMSKIIKHPGKQKERLWRYSHQ